MRIDTVPATTLINAAMPVTLDETPLVRSDVLLRAVKVTNPHQDSAQITAVSLTAMAGQEALRTVQYTPERIAQRAADLVPLLVPFEKAPDNERSYFGTTGFWSSEQFVPRPELEPGQMTGFMLEHVVVLAPTPVDTLTIAVQYERGDGRGSAGFVVPVREYVPQNTYHLPVRGSWLVVNNWDDLHGHRDGISMEFGIDLVQPNDEGLFLLDQPNEAYGFYGADVLAAADGEVAVVKDFCPENPRAGLRAEMDVRKVYQEQGLKAITAGNHVIIRHPHGECSFYAHLIRGSIRVREGDRVHQEQVIGALGNCGSSDAPHLHFHLMDGVELGARGLPCRFANIVDTFGLPCAFITQNFSTVRTIDGTS